MRFVESIVLPAIGPLFSRLRCLVLDVRECIQDSTSTKDMTNYSI